MRRWQEIWLQNEDIFLYLHDRNLLANSCLRGDNITEFKSSSLTTFSVLMARSLNLKAPYRDRESWNTTSFVFFLLKPNSHPVWRWFDLTRVAACQTELLYRSIHSLCLTQPSGSNLGLYEYLEPKLISVSLLSQIQ